MKIKYLFSLIATILLASCNNDLDLNGNPNSNQSILLSSDEYISIAYDNQTTKELIDYCLDYH